MLIVIYESGCQFQCSVCEQLAQSRVNWNSRSQTCDLLIARLTYHPLSSCIHCDGN